MNTDNNKVKVLFRIDIDGKEKLKCMANDQKRSMSFILCELIEKEWAKLTKEKKGVA